MVLHSITFHTPTASCYYGQVFPPTVLISSCTGMYKCGLGANIEWVWQGEVNLESLLNMLRKKTTKYEGSKFRICNKNGPFFHFCEITCLYL